MEIKLRQYKETDQDAVWNLHIEGLNQTGSYVKNPEYDKDLKNIKSTYIESGGDFLVATLQNKIIGIGALRKIDAETAEIKRMRVDPVHQGKKYGSIILDTLIEKAKQCGFKKIILDTTNKQVVAQNLYESRGFHEYKRKKLENMELIYFELLL